MGGPFPHDRGGGDPGRRAGRPRLALRHPVAWLARSAAQLRAGTLEAARASRQRCAEVAGAKFSPFVRVELNLLAARHALATGDPIGARRRIEAAGGELEARRGIDSLRPQLVGLQVDLALATTLPLILSQASTGD